MFLTCFLVIGGTFFFFLMFILLSRICITTTIIATVATYLFSILFTFTSPAADVEERRRISATVREHAIRFSSVNANNTLC